ncbi:angiopoietin-related protein 2-like [Mytilus trossulus]|uniref:angiopoietin-related protein 2-like n=1 Tax=Mytilus trossulus TaxID=6551 RepID=UPI0030044020
MYKALSFCFSVDRHCIVSSYISPHHILHTGSCKVGLTTANDCSEVQSRGHDCSGVYTIKPSSTSTVQVWCDLHTDGGRWTVVQRRQDGSVDFDMNWVSYRTGFGDPRTEYWIGNENLFGLTSSGKTELLILMETWNGVWRYARYSEFWISSESDKYRLGLSGYRGTAGDSLINSSQQAGCQFSTRDRDNDKFYEGACTDFVSGGFWYNLCAMATLNGYYYTSAVTGVPTCHWNTFKYQESLKTVYMMVRKV